MSNAQISRVTTGKISPELPATTSLGRKYWMAISGVFLFLFVVGHMLGNLQIFLGQDQINTYAEKLRDLGPLLWIIRGGLLLIALVHIIDGVILWLRNRQSRPERYIKQNFQRASLASRTMIWSGIGILLYVVYHLMHFTWQITNPQYQDLVDPLGRHDVYSMMVLGFQNWLISGVYIVAMVFLAYHLSHGVASFFQSMGWSNDRLEPLYRRLGYAVAVILFIGYVSIPAAILAGIVTLPGGGH